MIAAGEIAVPGDKSVTHRALLVAALAEGESVLGGALASRDTRATAACLRALGVSVTPMREGATVVVSGKGLGSLRRPGGRLDCRNSGTTARLVMGLLAAHPFTATLTGDRSLRRRPMTRVTEPLRMMGARFESADGRLPVTVSGGALRAISYDSPVASAQVKSAVLLAALSSRVPVSVTEPFASRDHTERLLRLLGVGVTSTGTRVSLEPVDELPPFQGHLAGDSSSAAYLVGAATLAGGGELRIRDVGVNPTRTGYLRVLARMGAAVGEEQPRESLGEPVATLVVRPAGLRATDVEPGEVPSLVDEVPLLACLAARAEGTSRFRGVGELRVKESDRLALVAGNLRAVGVRAESEGDTLWVEGTAGPPRGRVETDGDHRLAMAFSVLNVVPGASVEVDDLDCAAVSYPTFLRDLRSCVRP